MAAALERSSSATRVSVSCLCSYQVLHHSCHANLLVLATNERTSPPWRLTFASSAISLSLYCLPQTSPDLHPAKDKIYPTASVSRSGRFRTPEVMPQIASQLHRHCGSEEVFTRGFGKITRSKVVAVRNEISA
ncbi:hypothetical protein PM082_000116 [Marasmius tenuissimus]|nr:hypothetical protein PM082_000116 [Marasmius tenuissimus]